MSVDGNTKRGNGRRQGGRPGSSAPLAGLPSNVPEAPVGLPEELGEQLASFAGETALLAGETALAPALAAGPVAEVIEAVTSSAPLLAPTPAPAAEIASAFEHVQQDHRAAEPVAPSADEKGSEDMATVTAPIDATDKVQAIFGDASARFKSAFEKTTKLSEDFVELTKGNVEALVASARVAAKGGETLGQDAAEYGKKSFESAVAQIKSLTSVKSPTELFQLQSDYAKTSFDSFVAQSSKLSESLLKLVGEAAQPLSNRYAVAAEKIKVAAL